MCVFLQAASTASGYGVRFNVLCPGFVQTDLFSTILDKLGQFSNLADVTQKYADQGVLKWVFSRRSAMISQLIITFLKQIRQTIAGFSSSNVIDLLVMHDGKLDILGFWTVVQTLVN